MKHKTNCLLLLFFPLLLSSQNWLPLPPGYRFSYRHSDSSYVNLELETVSETALPDGSTEWQLNRIGRYCDTCSLPVCYGGLGQWLQQSMTLRADGTVYLSGERHFLLKPNAVAGETWLFDTLNQVRATVTSVVKGVILGQPDSIKIVALDNARFIVLGRALGIISWPDLQGSGDWTLSGIRHLGAGSWTPRYREIYDFQPGDVFQYSGWFTQDPGTANTAYTSERIDILARWEISDTLFYRVDHRKKIQYFGPFATATRDTTVLSYHPALTTPWTECWPNQLFAKPDLFLPGGASDATLMSRTYRSAQYGLSKSIGGNITGGVSYPGCQAMAPDPGGQPELYQCDPCLEYTDQVSAGLGLTFHRYGCFEYFEENSLSAFVKNGDTTGVLLPDNFYSAVHEARPDILLSVQPNPASVEWSVIFPPLPQKGLILLYNTFGQLLFSAPLERGQTRIQVPAEQLPAGVYMLEVRSGENHGVCRVLKNR